MTAEIGDLKIDGVSNNDLATLDKALDEVKTSGVCFIESQVTVMPPDTGSKYKALLLGSELFSLCPWSSLLLYPELVLPYLGMQIKCILDLLTLHLYLLNSFLCFLPFFFSLCYFQNSFGSTSILLILSFRG